MREVGSPLVLCYHAVSPNWPATLSVSPAAFRRQMRLLSALRYRSITLTEAITTAQLNKAVVITFDDGYRSVLRTAKPILDSVGFRGTVFVPTNWVGSERPMRWGGIERWHGTVFEDELVPLNWAELKELQRCGWEVGSHTCTHPRLSQIDRASQLSELVESKARIEMELACECTSLAYPYGDFDPGVEQAVREAGFQVAVALSPPPKIARPTAWPRVGVYNGQDLAQFIFKLSPHARGAVERLRDAKSRLRARRRDALSAEAQLRSQGPYRH